MDITIGYIRGWFDRSCAINVGTRSLFVRSKRDQPLRNIAVALEGKGVSNSFVLRNDQWELRIGTREALEAFRSEIGFGCPSKSEKLDTILNSYN